MKRPSLLIIFLTVFIDLIGFGIVLPLLPKYAERFGAEGVLIGLVISIFSVMQFFFTPMWGRLSDRIGRRPVLLVSNAASAGSYALFAIAAFYPGQTGLWILLISRAFAGICGANLSVASAYIADLTTLENRSKGMALIGIAFGLGFILGPALGAISAASLGLSGPGWVAAGICAFNFLLGTVILQESRKPGSEGAPHRPKFEQWLHTFRQPKLALLIALFFLATFCFTCFESTLPLLVGSSRFREADLKDASQLAARLSAPDRAPAVERIRSRLSPQTIELLSKSPERKPALAEALVNDLNALLPDKEFYEAQAFTGLALREETQRAVARPSGDGERLFRRNRLLIEDTFPAAFHSQRLHFDESEIGYLFAYCGVIAVLIQGGAIGRLVKRFGEPHLILISFITVACSLVLIPYAGAMGALLIGLGLFAAGSGVNRAPTMGLISIHSPAEEQGATLGVAQSVGTLARICGPLFATTAFEFSRVLPYLVCAAIALVAGAIAWRFLCRTQAETRTGSVTRTSDRAGEAPDPSVP